MPDPELEIGAVTAPSPTTSVAADQSLFIGSDTFRREAFGANHPLKIIRHAAVLDLVRLLDWLPPGQYREAPEASFDQLVTFHDRDYVEALQYANSAGIVDAEIRARYNFGTLENPVFKGLFTRAATTVGGSILAAELALAGRVVFHPSGGTHHGRQDHAAGFCYFNDPVFAIRTFLANDVARVAYVDIDAHHGDGVEAAFAQDPRVMTISIHERDRWPYSGTTSDLPAGIVNLPVPAGFNDTELGVVREEVVLPLIEQRSAEAVVLCCGADALAGDPLSGLMLTNVALWNTVDRIVAMGLPTVVLGGGGYNPWTLTRYWTGLWGRLAGHEIPNTLPEAAQSLLAGMECDLIDDDEVRPSWLTTMADCPYPGPVGDAVESLVRSHAP